MRFRVAGVGGLCRGADFGLAGDFPFHGTGVGGRVREGCRDDGSGGDEGIRTVSCEELGDSVMASFSMFSMSSWLNPRSV